jgi:predicted lipid carrier protein YhbT
VARTRTRRTIPSTLTQFAQALPEQISTVWVLLLGSRARKQAAPDRDYDFIIVSRIFEGVRDRGVNLRNIFYEIGGPAQGTDLTHQRGI